MNMLSLCFLMPETHHLAGIALPGFIKQGLSKTPLLAPRLLPN